MGGISFGWMSVWVPSPDWLCRSNINVIISILLDEESISFEASLVMYINSTNIPSIIIMNSIYKNKNLLYIVPLIIHTVVVDRGTASFMEGSCE